MNEELEEGYDAFRGTFRCSNCRGSDTRKPLHSYVKNGEPIVNCNHKECRCKCLTHYACHYGKLHAYHTKCNCKELEPKPLSEEQEQYWDEYLKKLGIHSTQLHPELHED